jgi:branched-chain amino acid transport system ATP-binding protein
MSVFEVKDVSLRFGGVQAIGNVSFNVEQGEVFAIIGPNGAGKTSMLNVITGYSTHVRQRAYSKAGHHPPAAPQGGAQRHRPHLPEHRTVRRAAPCSTTCCSGATASTTAASSRRSGSGHRRAPGRSRARAQVEDVIDLLDLMPHRNSPVAGLPYGVRKVVELARALATQPRCCCSTSRPRA